MRTTLNWIMGGLGLLLTVPAHAAGVGVDLLKLPLRFEPVGERFDGATAFVARAPGLSALVTPTGVRLRLQAQPQPEETDATRISSLGLNLVGANPSAQLTGREKLPGKVNYFRGNDPAPWRRNVPTFARVRCEQVYPGIDLVYYGTSQEQLEHDFIVAPGADPGKIALAVEGADSVHLDAQGDLVVEASGGQMRLRKPVIYQMIDGHRHDVAGDYRVRDPAGPQPLIPNPQFQVPFRIADYNPSFPLVMDPVLDYATYLGGSGDEYKMAGPEIETMSTGKATVAGLTASTNFPTTSGAFHTQFGGGPNDLFVTRFQSGGASLVFSTYLGGESWDASAA